MSKGKIRRAVLKKCSGGDPVLVLFGSFITVDGVLGATGALKTGDGVGLLYRLIETAGGGLIAYKGWK